jgi:hypothetical protein
VMRVFIVLTFVLGLLAGAGSIVSIAQSGDATDTAKAARRVVDSRPAYLSSATVEQMLVKDIGAPERDQPTAVCVRGEGNLYDCAYRDLQSPRTRLQVRAEPGRIVVVRDRTPLKPSSS